MEMESPAAMKLVTARDKIRAAADQWKARYLQAGEWESARDREVYERLRSLDVESATAEEVTAIVGSPLWTEYTCDECGARVNEVIEFGGASWGGRPCGICRPCLARARLLVSN
jgi:hypothetical protein